MQFDRRKKTLFRPCRFLLREAWASGNPLIYKLADL